MTGLRTISASRRSGRGPDSSLKRLIDIRLESCVQGVELWTVTQYTFSRKNKYAYVSTTSIYCRCWRNLITNLDSPVISPFSRQPPSLPVFHPSPPIDPECPPQDVGSEQTPAGTNPATATTRLRFRTKGSVVKVSVSLVADFLSHTHSRMFTTCRVVFPPSTGPRVCICSRWTASLLQSMDTPCRRTPRTTTRLTTVPVGLATEDSAAPTHP